MTERNLTGERHFWWDKPRTISVVVDNPSWILNFAERFVAELNASGDSAVLVRSSEDVPSGDIAFYLGCVKLTPGSVMARNRLNLAVHESRLPDGKGFSPLSWQILKGGNVIPVTLFELNEQVDSGPVLIRDELRFEGHELVDELRSAQGRKTIELCWRCLNSEEPPCGTIQAGESTYYARRRPSDSRIDPNKSIAEQFELLRIVDNEKYPAYFDYRGCRYVLKIVKSAPDDCTVGEG